MSRIGNLFYRLFIDDKGLVADATKAGKKAGDAAGDAAGKGLSGGLKKSLTGGGMKQGLLQGLGLGAGLGAVSALTAGVGAATDAIAGMIDAASDQREAMSLSTQVFEENAGEMQEWADTADTAFGQSKREALDFAAKFGNAFKNVGFSLDETAEKSKTMTRLAADLASAFNSTSEEASTALRSGLLGESEPLRRFGVFLSEAAVQAKAAQMGIAKLGDKLTDGQKVAARYAIIMEQTADSQGMFGRDTESLADAQKSAQAQMENLAAELGTELLPIMVELTNATVGLVTGIVALAKAADDALEPLGGLGGLLETVSTAYGGVGFQALKMANDAKKAGVRAGEDTSDMRKVMATNLGKVEGAIEGVGDEAEKTADRVTVSGREMRAASRTLRDAWLADALAILGDYYDPLIARADLLAGKQEASALRAIIASKDSTDAEIADAKRRLTEISKSNEQLLLELASQGKLTTAELNKAITSFQKRWLSATGDAREQLRLLARSLLLVKIAAQQASGAINTTLVRPGEENRASGGPVSAGVPYVVGEKRRELFVPDVDGTILPRVPNGVAMAGAGGGGDTYQIGVTMPVQVAPDPFEVGNQLRRLADYKKLTVPKR